MIETRNETTQKSMGNPPKNKQVTNNEDTPIISVRHVSKIYPVEDDEPVKALDDVSLDIYPGEICCIFGQSGSGKSTLLNQLAGLEKPEIGAIRIQNTILNRLNEEQLAVFRQKHIGFVFQSYNLLGHLNALEKCGNAAHLSGCGSSQAKAAGRKYVNKSWTREENAALSKTDVWGTAAKNGYCQGVCQPSFNCFCR